MRSVTGRSVPVGLMTVRWKERPARSRGAPDGAVGKRLDQTSPGIARCPRCGKQRAPVVVQISITAPPFPLGPRSMAGRSILVSSVQRPPPKIKSKVRSLLIHQQPNFVFSLSTTDRTAADEGEYLGPVAVQLGCPDPRDGCQAGGVGWPLLGDGGQRGIGEDHEGGTRCSFAQ